MKKSISRGQWFFLNSAVALMLFSGFLALLMAFRQKEQLEADRFWDQAQHETLAAAGKIAKELGLMADICRQTADRLSAGNLEKENIAGFLKQTMQANPLFFGFGIAYRPFANDPEVKLFAPYYLRRNGVLQHIQLEDIYDYSAAEHNWFNDPLERGAMWNEPYFGRASQTMLAEFAAPFTKKNPSTGTAEVAGIVYINYSIDEVRDFVKNLDFGRLGYAAIVSKSGKFIYHPIYEYVLVGKPILEVQSLCKNDRMRRDIERSIASRTALMRRQVLGGGQRLDLILQPIDGVGWSLVGVFQNERHQTNRSEIRRQIFWLILIIEAGCAFVLLALCFWARENCHRHWLLMASISFLLLLGNVSLWYVAQRFASEKSETIMLYENAGMHQFLEKYTTYNPKEGRSTLFIPTGIFIEGIKWKTNHDIQISGYVWQKYPKSLSEDHERGFIFPDVVETESEEIEIVSKREVRDEVLWTWRFKVAIREKFDYRNYPFDFQNAKLRILPKSFGKNVTLAPDLDAYKSLNPNQLPGLRVVAVPGWTLKQSYFSFNLSSYNANFGMENYIGQEDFPELCFNVILKRDFFSPFVSHIVPITVVAVMLFVLFLLIGKQHDFAISGFSVMAALGTTAGLFFVLIMSHIDFRNTIQTASFIFLEILYFMMYMDMLVVTVVATLFMLKRDLVLRRQSLGKITTMVYWPLLLTSLQLATLLVFY